MFTHKTVHECFQQLCSLWAQTGNNTDVLQQTDDSSGVRARHGVQLNNKKKQAVDTLNSLDGPPENYMQEKRQSQKRTYCMISFMGCP